MAKTRVARRVAQPGKKTGLAAGVAVAATGSAEVAGRWPADHVERRPVAALVPYARNARLHSDEQVAELAASIREWGWTMPVLVDEADGIIAGHGRLLAAHRLGLAEVPVMVARGWSEAQKRAYVIADNKLTLNASWDDALLALEMGDLREAGFDLGLTGFDDIEVKEMFARAAIREGLTDGDAEVEVPTHTTARPGDCWLLGHHRLVCGDATDPAVVERCLNGARPNLMVTDPPYGVDYDPNWRNRVVREDGSVVGAKATGIVNNDGKADWREAWNLYHGDVAYVWHGAMKSVPSALALESAGFVMRTQIIWAKHHLVIGMGDYHWQHEACWYAVRKGGKGWWAGDRKQSSVWFIDAPSGWRQQTEGPEAHSIHSTQKPIECMRRPMENNSRAGDAVYEPFCGSGTTIIAGEQTGRIVHAIEIDPRYVDVAIRRWQDFTGLRAELEHDGRSFAEVEVERLPEESVSPQRNQDHPGHGNGSAEELQPT